MSGKEYLGRESASLKCSNCNYVIVEAYRYCPDCGQKLDEKLTISLLFNNTISNYFSVDARFFRSFIPLLFRPGYLALEFVKGKRKTYLHPAQFYLFISVVFFFIFSFKAKEKERIFDERLKKGIELSAVPDSVHLTVAKQKLDSLREKEILILDDQNSEASETLQTVLDSLDKDSEPLNVTFDFDESVLDSMIRHNAGKEERMKAMGMSEDAGWLERKAYGQMLKVYERRGGGFLKGLFDTIPISLFFVLPIFALLVKLLYRKRGTYAHHLVFSFYFFTFIFCLYTFYLLPGFFLNLPAWIGNAFALGSILYLILAMRKFYSVTFWKALWKSVLLALSLTVVVVPITFIIMLIVTVLTY